MRIELTVPGIVVLVIGLIVLGVGAAYYTGATRTAGEWAGAIVTAVGLIAGIAGAAMKTAPKPVATATPTA